MRAGRAVLHAGGDDAPWLLATLQAVPRAGLTYTDEALTVRRAVSPGVAVAARPRVEGGARGVRDGTVGLPSDMDRHPTECVARLGGRGDHAMYFRHHAVESPEASLESTRTSLVGAEDGTCCIWLNCGGAVAGP